MSVSDRSLCECESFLSRSIFSLMCWGWQLSFFLNLVKVLSKKKKVQYTRKHQNQNTFFFNLGGRPVLVSFVRNFTAVSMALFVLLPRRVSTTISVDYFLAKVPLFGVYRRFRFCYPFPHSQKNVLN